MGWSNQAIQLIILTEETTGFSGMFGYSPTPAAGNLVFSIAARAGTDPYGNTYPAGVYSAQGYWSGIVNGSQIENGTIPSGKFVPGAIQTSDIGNNQVTNALLAAAAVAENNIQNGAVTAAQINAAAGILGSQLSSSAGITSGQISSVDGTTISAGTVPQSSLNSAITARSLGGITTTISATAPASPVAGDIWINTSQGNQLTQWNGTAWTAIYQDAGWTLQGGTIIGSLIAAATITGSLIAAGTITAGNIESGTITATQIAAATITGSLIAAGTITASNISAGTITSSLIASDAIVAGLIAAGAIDSFTINSPTINGGTISGCDFYVQAGSNNAILVYSTPGTTVQTFTTAGTFTWTCPPGVTSVKAECWGGGGGAGSSSSGSGGGGGGEYAAEASFAVTAGSTYYYSIGAGGTAGASGSDGQAGVVTWFNSTNAQGGVVANGGGAGLAALTGGAGGTGSTNTTHFDGGAGGSGINALTESAGGGGGGSGGTGSAGNAGGNASAGIPGTGAVAVTGGGPGGNGGSSVSGASPSAGPGGGGGGSGGSGGGTGGAGWQGQVRLTYTGTAPVLAASISAVAGTDAYGNAYPAGICVGPATGEQVLLQASSPNGELAFPLNAATAFTSPLIKGGAIGSPEYADLVLSGPQHPSHLDQVYLAMFSSNGTSNSNGELAYVDTTSTTYEAAYWDNTGFNITAGSVVAQSPGASVPTREFWNSLSVTGFGTITLARYKRLAEANFIYVDLETSGSSAANGTVIATLPSGYIPANQMNLPLTSSAQATGQSPHIYIPAGTGQLKVYGVTSTASCGGHWMIPLD